MDQGQLIFLSVAAVFVLYQTIQGWRLGLVRQLVRFGALAGAYAAGYLGGGATVPFLRPLGYPDFVLHGIGGVGLGLLTYLAISVVGGILFKRTAHQEVGLVWFFYGITGATLGLVFGLVLVLLIADVVRLLGGLVETKYADRQPRSQPAKPPVAAHRPSLIPVPPAPSPKPEMIPLHAGLIQMKHSLESGAAGDVLKTIDPMPKKVYVVSAKIGQMVSDQEAVTRFLTYPGAKELVEMPEIQALHDDPDILAAVRDKNYLILFKNPKLVKLANDPKIAAKVGRFDLEKALDYANKK